MERTLHEASDVLHRDNARQEPETKWPGFDSN
jgi:hypothetical protein